MTHLPCYKAVNSKKPRSALNTKSGHNVCYWLPFYFLIAYVACEVLESAYQTREIAFFHSYPPMSLRTPKAATEPESAFKPLIAVKCVFILAFQEDGQDECGI